MTGSYVIAGPNVAFRCDDEETIFYLFFPYWGA